MRGDEVPHEFLGGRVIRIAQLDTSGSKMLFGPLESVVFTNDDRGDFVQQNRPAAHVTRRQG